MVAMLMMSRTTMLMMSTTWMAIAHGKDDAHEERRGRQHVTHNVPPRGRQHVTARELASAPEVSRLPCAAEYDDDDNDDDECDDDEDDDDDDETTTMTSMTTTTTTTSDMNADGDQYRDADYH